jgi:hypothetical protein
VVNIITKKPGDTFTRNRLILINSGVTATTKGSSGDGGVWYAGTTDFGSVTLDKKGADGAPIVSIPINGYGLEWDHQHKVHSTL